MKQRAQKVAEELRKIVSMILLNDLADSRVGFITVTRIEVTDDLRNATIYYSVLGDEEARNNAEEALEEHHRFIRHLVVERINMKFAMEIVFQFDDAIDENFKIEGILRKIKEGGKA